MREGTADYNVKVWYIRLMREVSSNTARARSQSHLAQIWILITPRTGMPVADKPRCLGILKYSARRGERISDLIARQFRRNKQDERAHGNPPIRVAVRYLLSPYHSNCLTTLIPGRPVQPRTARQRISGVSTATLIIREHSLKKTLESPRNPNVAKRYPYLTDGSMEWGQYDIDWPEYDPVNQTYFNLSKSARISKLSAA